MELNETNGNNFPSSVTATVSSVPSDGLNFSANIFKENENLKMTGVFQDGKKFILTEPLHEDVDIEKQVDSLFNKAIKMYKK